MQLDPHSRVELDCRQEPPGNAVDRYSAAVVKNVGNPLKKLSYIWVKFLPLEMTGKLVPEKRFLLHV